MVDRAVAAGKVANVPVMIDLEVTIHPCGFRNCLQNIFGPEISLPTRLPN